ncbi:MAG: citrate synthase [Clostridia bacterium]|nr:citrate synthase [Clostridia bacterium]
MDTTNDILRGYVNSLCEDLRSEYTIASDTYSNKDIKRGLRNLDGTGVMIGVTRVGSVQGYYVEDGERMPMPGHLYYRGYKLQDIVESHTSEGTFGYEEVAYLLIMGKLPTAEQLSQFNAILSSARNLPPDFTEDMILKAPSRDIMNKLARSVLALYSYDSEADDMSIENLVRQSIELIGRFPVIVANAYAAKRHYYDGKSLYLHVPRENLSSSENFMRMIRKDKKYTHEEALLLDMMLMMHAEHGGGNNSTFSCRVLSSAGTDTYSAIAAAVGSLRGSLHGGANAKVMAMFNDVKAHVRDIHDDDEISAYLNKILDGDAGDGSGKLYGIGHAVYTVSDPRTVLIKKYAGRMAEIEGRAEDFSLMQSIDRLGCGIVMARKGMTIPICANIDMYSGLIYSMLGIPADLYTPLFATARIAGWCAHRIEEIVSGGRIMRPAYRAAVKKTPYIPMGQR